MELVNSVVGGKCKSTADLSHIPVDVLVAAATARGETPLVIGKLCKVRAACATPTPASAKRPARVDKFEEDDNDHEYLDGRSCKKMYEDYVRMYGGPPLYEEEPTRRQLGDLKRKLDDDENPYADFSKFGGRA